MVVVGLALIGAIVVAAVLVIVRVSLTLARGHQLDVSELVRWTAAIVIGNFVLDLAILYFAMPALTGPYNGWEWLLWPMLLTGVAVLLGSGWSGSRVILDMFAQSAGGAIRDAYPGIRRARVVNGNRGGTAPFGRGQAGLFVIILVVLTVVVVNGLVVVATTWFDPNARALAAIGNIQRVSKSTPLPPTDVNHIVLVTQGVAAYLGQQVLASTNQNLGSTYHTEPSSYTLQSVNHHLYWIAPLVYNNVFANLANQDSPGYVVVDAEDPNVQATLRTGYHLHYLPGAILNQDLLRHVYLSGFTYGNLVEPTLEVRDDWRPYFTVSLMQPTRGFTGDKLHSVLLADPQTGAVTEYLPAQVPSWVDRVVPDSTVSDYLTWWGQWESAPWFNPSGTGRQLPATDTPELVYNNADKPVWLMPMTSGAASDNSSTGVVLYDTHDTVGHFYPLAGLGVGDNVTTTFQSNPHNLKNYQVGGIQLYQIYGVPTWVAIFVQPNGSGENFAAVGMVDARHLINSNVIMASTKADALTQYAQSLGAGTGTSGGPASSGQIASVSGKVSRIAAATENGSTVYYIYIQGQSRIFKANLSLSPQLPLAREGDTIQGTYLDTGQSVVTMTAFSDTDVPLVAPALTATP